MWPWTSRRLHEQLIALCKRLLGEKGGNMAWRAIDAVDLEVTRISGGITNMLYRVGPREGAVGAGAAPRMLVRVFGKAGDVVCDRACENETFAELSASAFGPTLYGLFGNGRLEGWMEGRRPLEALEMLQVEPIDFQTLTAQRLADMHMRCKPVTDLDIWAQLREWVELGKKVAFPNDSVKAEKLKRLDPWPRFEVEVDFCESVLPSPANGHGERLLDGNGLSPALKARKLLYERCFCHLDLLSGNIMYSEAAGDVRFIDFEYAMYCHIGLDIANHFNAVPESCLILNDSFEPDKYYPSQKLQRKWIRAYLEARSIPVDDELLEAVLVVVLDFALLAEIRWVVWSVVQAGYSPVDFDYLDYGVMRFEQGYLKYKAWREAGRRPAPTS